MKFRWVVSIAIIGILSGCVTATPPVKPAFPSARIYDTSVSEDGGRAAFFILSEVDGVPIEENAMSSSIRASHGLGRNLRTQLVYRYVAAGKHRLKLTATYGVAAPIEYLLRPSSFAKVTGEVEVELKPDLVYQVRGILEPLKRQVWLEEWQSQTPVGPRIIDLEVADEAAKAMAGAKFTCCNLHYEGDWISDANQTTLPMIPAGSRIVVKDYGFNRASVLIDAHEMRIGHDYGRKQESKEQYVEKLIVNDDPQIKIKTFPPVVQQAIAAGKVCKGMTHEQVIIALGYPRTDETPSLSAREWKYWTANWDEYRVVWGDDGLVEAISSETDVLGQIVLPTE